MARTLGKHHDAATVSRIGESDRQSGSPAIEIDQQAREGLTVLNWLHFRLTNRIYEQEKLLDGRFDWLAKECTDPLEYMVRYESFSEFAKKDKDITTPYRPLSLSSRKTFKRRVFVRKQLPFEVVW
ncbi:hypothetical protein COS16_00620 [Candidatus Desantisbacteria bacterium CG02_land_8_20_14_3_00_49_13]|nr:MAG: hypothetical protein COS16_00620 [Candidatus Desantisbacteria bacterium CG02_land_8_20_14_3_00_49_13]